MNSITVETNQKLLSYNENFAQKDKWLFRIDGVKSDIKIRVSLCWRTLGIGAGVLYNTIRNAKNNRGEKRYLWLLHSLESKGIDRKSIANWEEEGISLAEVKAVIVALKENEQKTSKQETLLQKLANELEEKGDRLFFTELFKDLIPEQVFMILVYDEFNSAIKFAKLEPAKVLSPKIVKSLPS